MTDLTMTGADCALLRMTILGEDTGGFDRMKCPLLVTVNDFFFGPRSHELGLDVFLELVVMPIQG